MPQLTQTKKLTSSGQITLYPCKIYSITASGAVAANTLALIDNTTNGSGGTAKWDAAFTLSAVDSRHYNFPEGLSCLTNAYLTIANASAATITFKDNS